MSFMVLIGLAALVVGCLFVYGIYAMNKRER